MNKYRPARFTILLSGLLLYFFSTVLTILHGVEQRETAVMEEDSTLEQTAKGNSSDDKAPQTTETQYRLYQMRFEGNEHLNQKTLTNLFRLQEGQAYSRPEIIAGFERILSAYRRAGFVFAEITPETRLESTKKPPSKNPTKNAPISVEQVSLKISIVEGKRVRTGVLTLEGNQRFSESEIRDELGLRQGQLFTQLALERGIERIQTLYSEQGYPKVEVEPTHFQLSSETGTVDFQLNIREGSQIRIGEVKVSGLQKTKTEVVLREIPVKPSQRFDQRTIDTSYRRLRNLGYFYQINPNLLEAGETEDRINFHAQVTEARTGRLSGVIGYAPPDSEADAAPQLTGVLEARETNLLGTGRQVNFYWKSGLLRTLRIGYEEPWIFGKPITIGVEYGQLKQRNPVTETESEEQSGSLSGKTNFGRSFEGSLTLGYKKINVPDGHSLQVSAIEPSGFLSPMATSLDTQFPLVNTGDIAPFEQHAYSGTKYSVTLGLARDTRDYFLNPTQGRRDSIAFEVSRSDFRLRKIWLSLQQYFPTWQKQTVAIELHGAAAWGINIPPTELFYLGGANTLRGYDEDWFSGPRRVYANLEYRFLVGQASQVFAFTDLGAVTFIERPSVFDTLRIGYGFGVRLESKGGILRLDYGLAAGDSALRGKIHVNLGASF